MGLEQSVTFPGGTHPDWPAACALLQRQQFPVQVRMIDGALAFPDETPSPEWRELRLGCAAGMVTLRRAPQQVSFIVWGNAGPDLIQARNALMWAFAVAGEGRIDSLSADEFLKSAEMPPELAPGMP